MTKNNNENSRENLRYFTFSLIFTLVYWRIYVFSVYNNGAISFLRQALGLTIHHYHYGIIFLTIAVLMLLFYKTNKFTIILTGFGLGTLLDSFISRLLISNGRIQEIANYNQSLLGTIFIFLIVITLSLIVYELNKRVVGENA